MGWLLPCKRYPWEWVRPIGRPAAVHLVPSVLCNPSAIGKGKNLIALDDVETGAVHLDNTKPFYEGSESSLMWSCMIEPSSSEVPGESVPLGCHFTTRSHFRLKTLKPSQVTVFKDLRLFFVTRPVLAAPSGHLTSSKQQPHPSCYAAETLDTVNRRGGHISRFYYLYRPDRTENYSTWIWWTIFSTFTLQK